MGWNMAEDAVVPATKPIRKLPPELRTSQDAKGGNKVLYRRSRRRAPRARRLFAALMSTALIALAAPPVHASDAWAGIRDCTQFESCRVQSYATGNVYHERCDTNGWNCVLKASWANGGSYTWRTSWHGSGSQMASISTTGTLSSQYATCVCVEEFCPE